MGRLQAAAKVTGSRAGGGGAPPGPLRARVSVERLARLRAAIWSFVEDDLAQGLSAALLLHCAACERGRPQPGFVRYGQYQFCNMCATEYELARVRGIVVSAGQYLRGKRFGDAEEFSLAFLDHATPG